MPPEAAGDTTRHEAEAVPEAALGTRPAGREDVTAVPDDPFSIAGNPPFDRAAARGGGRDEAGRGRAFEDAAEARDMAGRARRRDQGAAQGAALHQMADYRRLKTDHPAQP